jgi:hypothetical protein
MERLVAIVQLYRGGHFYRGMNPEKTTDLSQVTDKHILLHQINLDMSEIGTHNSSIISLSTNISESLTILYSVIYIRCIVR